MNKNFKKVISVISVIAVALCMVVVGFADTGAVVYLSYSKNSATGDSYADVYLRCGRSASQADLELKAADGTQISGCFGLASAGILKDVSYTAQSAVMKLTIDSGSYNANSNIYAGRVAFESDSAITNGDLSKVFSEAVLTLDGENEECRIVSLLTEEDSTQEDSSVPATKPSDEPSSEPTTNPIDEPSSEITTKPNDEPSSEITTKPNDEPSSEITTKPNDEPSSEITTKPADEPTTKPEEKPEGVYASAECYVYTDFNNNTYAAVSLSCASAKELSFDLKADSNILSFSGDAVMLGKGAAVAEISIDKDSDTASITARPSGGEFDDYIAYIPVKLADGVNKYGDFSKAFTTDYGFVNGGKMNIAVSSYSTAYTPDKYGENWFKGFDATYNTYGDGDDMREEFLFYAVGAGFAYNYSADFIFSGDVEIVSASAVDPNAVCMISENGDGSKTISVTARGAQNKTLDYRSILSVIVKTNDSGISYKNIWSHVGADSFITNGNEQIFSEFKTVSYLGNSEHYDEKDNVKYVSYDFAGKPGYTAVCGYTEDIGDTVNVASSVRNGYTVAQINKYAFKDCKAQSITLPDTIELILDGAFENCTALKEFTFPKAVYSIKDGAFAGCSSLEKLTFNNAEVLEDIGAKAFMDCPAYRNIELPAGNYNIGDKAFGFVTGDSGKAVPLNSVRFICVYGSPARTYAQKYGFDCINQGEDKFEIIKGKNVTMLYSADGNYVIIPPAKKLSDISDIFAPNGISGLADSKSAAVNDPNAAVGTGMKLLLEDSDDSIDIVVRGDLNGNGTISASEARTALRISAKLESADRLQTLAADVDYNGKVTASDARTILRVSARLEAFN